MTVVDVCIVGAGPTGLLLANILSLYSNINILIIDKKNHDMNNNNDNQIYYNCKCTTVQPRIVDIYKSIGMSEFDKDRHIYRLLSRTIETDGSLTVYSDFSTKDIDNEDDRSYYALSIPQYKIEEELLRLLQDSKGYKEGRVEIRFNSKVKRYSKSINNTYIVRIQNNINDKDEKRDQCIRCRFIAGCDGRNSIIRKYSGIEMIMNKYPYNYYTAEVYIDNFNYDIHTRHNFTIKNHNFKYLNNNNITGIYFMHIASLGNKLFRVFISSSCELKNIPFLDESNQKNNTSKMVLLTWLRTLFLSWKFNFTITKVVQFNKFEPYEGYVNQGSVDDSIFVLGDAAHINSPHGGQGLNTGAIDALNLGCKIGTVYQYRDNINQQKNYLLSTYSKEMLPIWEKMVHKVRFIKHVHEKKGSLLGSLIGKTRLPLLAPLFLKKIIIRNVANLSFQGSNVGELIGNRPVLRIDHTYSSKKDWLLTNKVVGYSILLFPKKTIPKYSVYSDFMIPFLMGIFIMMYNNGYYDGIKYMIIAMIMILLLLFIHENISSLLSYQHNNNNNQQNDFLQIININIIKLHPYYPYLNYQIKLILPEGYNTNQLPHCYSYHQSHSSYYMQEEKSLCDHNNHNPIHLIIDIDNKISYKYASKHNNNENCYCILVRPDDHVCYQGNFMGLYEYINKIT